MCCARCHDVYLYNNEADKLEHCPEIRSFFDFGLSAEENSIYLGEHCKGLYGKYAWQNGKLQIQEEYASNQYSETDTCNWHLEHFIYCDGGRVPAYTIPNLPLPEKWQQVFLDGMKGNRQWAVGNRNTALNPEL